MASDWILVANPLTRPGGRRPTHQSPEPRRSMEPRISALDSYNERLYRRSGVYQPSASTSAHQENTATVMVPEESRRTQKPYRYGMILLCFGALINWVGLAENYTEPIRYAGVACIIFGALLICTAMCCWLHTPPSRTDEELGENGEPIHVITVPDQIRTEKPPEYDTCVVQPPSYDDALQLSPAALLAASVSSNDLKHDTVPSYESIVTMPAAPTYMPPISPSGSAHSNSMAVVSPLSIMGAHSNRVAPLVATINVCRVTCVEAASIR